LPPILKSSGHSRETLVKYLLYNLNIIHEKHPFLPAPPFFTLLISALFSRTLDSDYVQFLGQYPFASDDASAIYICTVLVQFSWSDAFCHYMKHAVSSFCVK